MPAPDDSRLPCRSERENAEGYRVARVSRLPLPRVFKELTPLGSEELIPSERSASKAFSNRLLLWAARRRKLTTISASGKSSPATLPLGQLPGRRSPQATATRQPAGTGRRLRSGLCFCLASARKKAPAANCRPKWQRNSAVPACVVCCVLCAVCAGQTHLGERSLSSGSTMELLAGASKQTTLHALVARRQRKRQSGRARPLAARRSPGAPCRATCIHQGLPNRKASRL